MKTDVITFLPKTINIIMPDSDIIFDAERMKYPYSGLYSYCSSLARNIQKIIDQYELSIRYYVPENALEFIGGDAKYIEQKSLHKFYNPYKNRCKIWHCTFQGSNYFPFGGTCKKVITIHDLNFLHEVVAEKKINNYKKAFQKKIYAADVITTISDFVRKDIEDHFNTGGKKIEVIYNGFDIQRDLKTATPAFETGDSYLFSIGVIHPKKNIHVLPALLVGNNYHLIIAGVCQDELYKKKIIDEAVRLNVLDRLKIVGAVSEQEKYWLFENCKAFCFPSIAEGFGIPVIEAMSFGRPVFLSEYTSLPEIGGDLAYYFKDFGEVSMKESLEEGLKHFRENKPEQKLIERASRFTWDKAAKRYIEIYKSLAG